MKEVQLLNNRSFGKYWKGLNLLKKQAKKLFHT
jgi:hypothetical protein